MEAQGSIRRRLTAILAADAVGYSRHMGEDEEGTLRQLAAHRAVIDRIIAAHEGRILSTAGDSVLAEFASPVEAVRCAVEIQEGVHTRNEALPDAQRLEFRIGVNLGDGVNVAARLEGVAEPGGICISSSVYDQVAGKLSLGFVDLGEKSLKNIARPIRVYQFDRTGTFVGAKPSGMARRGAGLLGAVGALLVAGAIVVWQMGLLGPRGTAATPSPPASAPGTPPASEETKLKLQSAEADRARAEAELAKTRSDADAARERAGADAARQRTEMELARQRAAPRPASPERREPPPSVPAPAATAPAGATADAARGGNAAGAAPAAVSQTAPSVAPPSAALAVGASGPGRPPATTSGLLPTSAHGVATRECERYEELRAFSER